MFNMLSVTHYAKNYAGIIGGSLKLAAKTVSIHTVKNKVCIPH